MTATPNRLLALVATTLATVALAAAPALATEGDCEDDESDSCPQVPAQVVPAPPAPPTPVAPAPAPEAAPAPAPELSAPAGAVAGQQGSKKKKDTVKGQQAQSTRTARTLGTTKTVPVGGVQAGAGGTAEQAPDDALLGLAGGGLLLLVASSGGIVALARRGGS
jgi:hypothetical protein